ncbi:hypothetical protein Micbo1qcDRAFT_50768 [Microdochium bolleyi]|uniref:Secreted protein n=1 Tax=Microdochium bolleyi TaxID=196109 RepID=A0A136J6F8_9PEZI|nr:hypothetical protein Micbo1qcDRAFT_50768 [Microdochium bolleyi]
MGFCFCVATAMVASTTIAVFPARVRRRFNQDYKPYLTVCCCPHGRVLVSSVVRTVFIISIHSCTSMGNLDLPNTWSHVSTSLDPTIAGSGPVKAVPERPRSGSCAHTNGCRLET